MVQARPEHKTWCNSAYSMSHITMVYVRNLQFEHLHFMHIFLPGRSWSLYCNCNLLASFKWK